MNRTIKKLIAVLLAIVFVMQLVPAQAVDEFEPTYEVPFDEMEPVNTRIVPQFEEDMVMEAIAIGVANAEAAANGTAFTYDQDTNYSALLTDTDFQDAYADYVFSLELGNLQNLCDALVEAEFEPEDIEWFVDRWAVAFQTMPLEDIWWQVFRCGSGVYDEFLPLFGMSSSSDTQEMLQYAFEYYYYCLLDEFYSVLTDVVASIYFDLSYIEAFSEYSGTNVWAEFEQQLAECWRLVSYSYEWVMTVYLKNLYIMNDLFDEIRLAKNGLGIGLFETAVNSYDFSFRYDPSRYYGDFWDGISSAIEGLPYLLTLTVESDLGDAEVLASALADESYTQPQITAFINRMAEVLTYEPLPQIKDILSSDNVITDLTALLTTPSLATDMEDMVTVLYDCYSGIIGGILSDYENYGGTAPDFILSTLLWAVAGYLQSFAAMNHIVIPAGSIPNEPFTIKNYDLKEEVTVTGITIGFAEAQGIDVTEVDIDEEVMDDLLNAIMPLDAADLGIMLRGILLRKGTTADDLLVFTLLSAILGAESDAIDEAALADMLRMLNTYPIEDLFEELGAATDYIEEELEEEEPVDDEIPSDGIGEFELATPYELDDASDDTENGALNLATSSTRVLENFITYFLECWAVIREEVGGLFDANDDTLDYVLAWVTSLYIKNLAALNADEEVYDLAKSNTPLSKAEMEAYEELAFELVSEARLAEVVDRFSLDNRAVYDLVDAEALFERYYAGELDLSVLSDNAAFNAAILRPVEIINDLLEQSLSQADEEFSIIGTVVSMASAAMESTEGCGTGCNDDSGDDDGDNDGGNTGIGETGCVLPDSCSSEIIIELQFLVGYSSMPVNGQIQIEAVLMPDNGETVHWNIESGSECVNITTISQSSRIATLTSYSIGSRKVTAYVQDNQGRTIGSDSVTVLVNNDQLRDIINQNKVGNADVKDSVTYNHDLGMLCMQLSYKAYNPLPAGLSPAIAPGAFMGEVTETVKEALGKLGFTDSGMIQYYYSKHWLNANLNKAAHTIAHRYIVYDGIVRPIVVIAIRGTTNFIDWVTNVATVLSTPLLPLGFSVAAQNVCFNLDRYIEHFNLSNQNPMILLTGHSLGAAVANLVSSALSNQSGIWSRDNVFAYTFATPTVVDSISRKDDPNIFNILNSCGNSTGNHDGPIETFATAGCCDIVTHLPGLGIPFRNGKDAYIDMSPSPENPYISWIPFIGAVAEHHKMSTYLNWMTSLSDDINVANHSITWEDVTSWTQ